MLQSAEEALANSRALPKKVDEVEPTPDVRESMAVLEGKQYSSLLILLTGSSPGPGKQ